MLDLTGIELHIQSYRLHIYFQVRCIKLYRVDIDYDIKESYELGMVNTALKLTTNAFMLIEYINPSYLLRADDNQRQV